MLTWLIGWLFLVVLLLLLPLFYSQPLRERIRRIFGCCNATTGNRRQRRSRRNNGEDEFHFVISAEQEDEIRACFLNDKLGKYTTTLEEGDLIARDHHDDEEDAQSVTPTAAAGVPTTPPSPRLADYCQEGAVKGKCDLEESSSSGSEGKKTELVSDDGMTEDLELDESDEFEEAALEDHDEDFVNTAGYIRVPTSGALANQENISIRTVPNGCAICLCPFEAEDKITWSANPACQHVFHADCIKDWYNSSGRRHCRRRRRREQDVLNYAHDPLLKITKFPKDCPCCRQPFILDEERSTPSVKLAVEHGDGTPVNETPAQPEVDESAV